MKKIIMFLLLLIPTLMMGQFTEAPKYPKYEVDSTGQKVVVFTVRQAMDINNRLELLEMYQNMASEYNNYESICIKVVSEKDEVIAKQTITIQKLDGQLKIKDDKIALLQGEIMAWIERNRILEEQLKNKDDVVKVQAKQIRKLKTKIIVTGTLGGAALVATVLFLTGTIN